MLAMATAEGGWWLSKRWCQDSVHCLSVFTDSILVEFVYMDWFNTGLYWLIIYLANSG